MDTFQAEAALTDCDKEKVHLISRTQGHGAFLAFSSRDYKIKNISENLLSFLSKESDLAPIGRKLSEILGNDLASKVKEILRERAKISDLAFDFVYEAEQSYEVYLYSMGEEFYGLELEKQQKTDFMEKFSTFNTHLDLMKQSASLEELSNMTCRAVRKFTGFDRVMLYRFFPPTMYGEVIGEDRIAEAHSFFLHRFPASDIPKPARDLYLKNRIRFIFDSGEENFEVLPRVKNHSALIDMTDSRLRGSSLVHLEYLKNMGVVTSFSVAIIVNEELWGIIACHHSRPLFLSHNVRSLCLSLANVYALTAPVLERNVLEQEELMFYRRLHEVYSDLRKASNPLDQLFRNHSSMEELFSITGYAFVSPEKIDMSGATPLTQELKKLAAWVDKQMTNDGEDIFVTDHLSSLNPEFANLKDQASGILAIRTSENSSGILLLMRPEILSTIQWGGDPKKTLDNRNYQGQINPRQSFETWTEVVREQSQPWKKYQIIGLEQFKNLVFEVLINKEKLIQELTDRLGQ